MDILDIVITSNSKHVYIIDGKEWIVGEQKISKCYQGFFPTKTLKTENNDHFGLAV